MKKVRLAIIGTGGMANMHAQEFKKIAVCDIVAACDVNEARAGEFAAKYGIPAAYADAAKMLREVKPDAVTIVTPDASHAELSIMAFKAGAHVLCEKPLALNARDAHKMTLAARKAGKVNMVNFSYRNWPTIQAATRFVHTGALGEIRHVEAAYHQSWLVSTAWGVWHKEPGWLWRLSTAHGSQGTLGDIGVHIVDYATMPVGAIANVFCRLKTFHKTPGDRIGEYKLDANDTAILSVEFKNGAAGTVQMSRYTTGHQNRLVLEINGTKGALRMDSEVSTDTYEVCRGKDINTSTWRKVKCPATLTNYQRFIQAIRGGKPAGGADFARGEEIQRVLDASFASAKAGKVVVL